MGSFKNLRERSHFTSKGEKTEKRKLAGRRRWLKKIEKRKLELGLLTNNVIKFPKNFNGKKTPKIVDLDAVSASEDLDFSVIILQRDLWLI